MNRWKVACCALFAAALLQRAPAQIQEPSDAPVQPLPFSHRTHAGDEGLSCATCHPNPAPGDAMTIAPPSVCMGCHASIEADSAPIQRLAEYAKAGKPVPWVRIYQIPDFVNFSHRAHLAKGATCANCHGSVARRDRLYRETDLKMTGCVACHKARNASQDCGYCHVEML